MSQNRYKNYKWIIFAICMLTGFVFYIRNDITESSTATMNVRRLQGQQTPYTDIPPPEPQPLVQCTGVHALCIFAACDQNGECNCKQYDSLYQIAVGAIKNDSIREATLSTCTMAQPCDVNAAPICQAIIYNEYYVDYTLSEVTSTYSWDSFCDRAWPTEVWSECNQGLWASCMMAPCVPNPEYPDFALCQCDLNIGVEVPWIDNDPYQNCQYPWNVIKASVPFGFEFSIFYGTDYVYQACETNRNGYAYGQQKVKYRYDGRNYPV